MQCIGDFGTEHLNFCISINQNLLVLYHRTFLSRVSISYS